MEKETRCFDINKIDDSTGFDLNNLRKTLQKVSWKDWCKIGCIPGETGVPCVLLHRDGTKTWCGALKRERDFTSFDSSGKWKTKE